MLSLSCNGSARDAPAAFDAIADASKATIGLRHEAE
jgi:hypothetical protein